MTNPLLPHADRLRAVTVCFAVPHFPDSEEPIAKYLTSAHLHTHLPEALAQRGHEVHVVHLFHEKGRIRRNGVDYHFETGGIPAEFAGRVISFLRNRARAAYTPSPSWARTVAAIDPDLIHLHGTSLHLNHGLLNLVLGNESRPKIVAHFHGALPSRDRLGRTLQQFNLDRVDHFLFTTDEQIDAFEEVDLLPDRGRTSRFPELSSPYRRISTSKARRKTGMSGNPVVLSVARLDPVKDPMTSLRGFEIARDALPDPSLYMHYTSASLSGEIESYLRDRPELASSVHLLGAAPFERMPLIYGSADILVQSSTREFSGCAVLEALSCGVVPVVSDLPATRALTGEGKVGRLVPLNRPEAIADALCDLLAGDLTTEKKRALAHFREHLSYERLAARLEEIYRSVLDGPGSAS